MGDDKRTLPYESEFPGNFIRYIFQGCATLRKILDAMPPPTTDNLEKRVFTVSRLLSEQISQLLEAVPGNPQGPVRLAKAVGIDKVLASRVIRAAQNRDPVAALQMMPGPEPLRKLAQSAGKHGVPSEIVKAVVEAVDQYDGLIRSEAGDRGSLEAILAAWLPQSREKFEFSRKQSIFKSLSQLKGQAAATSLACAIMIPSEDGESIDVVWVMGLFGLHRVRPGSIVKFATRRLAGQEGSRMPRTLDGKEVSGLEGLRLDQFCSDPAPKLDVHHVGEVVHYVLGVDGVGPLAATDLVFAEVNREEIPRYVPVEARRKRHMFAEVTVPCRLLVFDVFIHEALMNPGDQPMLYVYDTSFEGVADVNDPTRDMDRMDLTESLKPLGPSIGRLAEVPDYQDLLTMALDKLGLDRRTLKGYRSRIDYPLYGSQVTVAFDAVSRPAP